MQRFAITPSLWAMRRIGRRPVLTRAAASTGLAAFLAACGGGQRAQSGVPQSSGRASPSDQRGPSGSITIAVGEEPPSFDVNRATGGVYNLFTVNVFEGLITRDEKGKIAPALAESWSVSPDGKIYEFRLRQNVKFHNGDPFTAEDVRFTYQRLRNPKIQPKQSSFSNWDDVVVVDRHTVRVHLKEPDPTFLGFISQGYNFNIVPSAYVQLVGDDDFDKKPVGTGPYRFVQRRVKESWELEAFQDYWGEKPTILKATFRVIPEASTAEAALDTGEVDMVANYPPPSYARNKGRQDVKFILNPASNTIDVRINLRRKTDPETGQPNPFLDKRVRQAMAYAVDRDAIIKNILGGVGEKIAVLFPEDPGYDPDLKPYPYDPSRAKALLAAAGYPSGFDTKFYGLLGQRIPMAKEVGEAIAQYFTAVGLRTKVINEEYALWLNRTSPSVGPELWPMGIGITFVGGAFHPAYGFRVYAGCDGSTSWVCDPTMERLIDQMYKELDPQKVAEYARQAARYVHDEAFVTVIYRNVNVYAMKPKIDFLPTAQSQYVELKNVRIRG